ncbi:MAG: hypothetical protein JSV56_04340, partial [Methanomassiliicoccales archaeon]
MKLKKNLTPYNMAIRNLRNNSDMWWIIAFCIATCVFVQCLLFGLFSGVALEAQKNPQNFQNPQNISNALRDWSFLIFYLAAIVIVLTLAISVI